MNIDKAFCFEFALLRPRWIICFLTSVLLVAAARAPEPVGVAEQVALGRINADSLRGRLSFLSSDALEGRGTPSRGLDVAAEYIASEFRRAGLEPAGPDGSYFQNAPFVELTPKLDGFSLTWKFGGKQIQITGKDVRLRTRKAVDVQDAGFVKLPAAEFTGKIVVGESQKFGRGVVLRGIESKRPSLIVLVGKSRRPGSAESSYIQDASLPVGVPVIRIASAELARALEDKEPATISIRAAAPVEKQVQLRNVAGILRGSDPRLREEYLVVSAHYDHLGMKLTGEGDRIYNGANDNGSGTVSVIEMASALASLKTHPKRSILFMTFFGEEEGLLGAYFYTHHPLVPLKNTVADINLEQMGRTDEQDGKQVGAFSFTGPSYSDLPSTLTDAAKLQGIKVYKKSGADAFFDRSDNLPFAEAGVVAHTIVVAYEYPDYHGLSDEWAKIDYDNMAKVDRGVAAGVLSVADTEEPPHWSDTEAAAKYRKIAVK